MTLRISVAFDDALGPGARRRVRGGGKAVARTVREAARATLEAEGVRDATLSITLLGDVAIAALNSEYLGHDGATDVLSFALHEWGGPPVGDVYIGFDQALRQAESLAVPAEEELARLAVHGTLHVLGYDHPSGAGRTRSAMWRRQERIVQTVRAS